MWYAENVKTFFILLSLLFIIDGVLYVLVPEWKKQVVQRFFVNVSSNIIRLYGIVIVVLAVLLLLFLLGKLGTYLYYE